MIKGLPLLMFLFCAAISVAYVGISLSCYRLRNYDVIELSEIVAAAVYMCLVGGIATYFRIHVFPVSCLAFLTAICIVGARGMTHEKHMKDG